MDIKEKIKTLPLSFGVYIMKSKGGEVLYVGKASSLRKRVSSYFLKNVSLKTGFLVANIADIDCIECESEEQALILEAALIKEKKPKYNIALRDDKSYPYVEITHDKFPRVFITRKRTNKNSLYLGPYPQAAVLKSVLNIIRRIFPYCSCKCFNPLTGPEESGGFPGFSPRNRPSKSHAISGETLPRIAKAPQSSRSKPCLFAHLRLCPAPCAGSISESAYKENIDGIIKILKGEREELIGHLRGRMSGLSKEKKFEEAASLRDKIVALENLYKGKNVTHELISLKEALNLQSIPLYMEAIDISSLSGTNATGSVVVFRNASADKDSYRRYRIKEVSSIDDYAMMAEVVKRRYSRLLKEKRQIPDLIIIDGGLGHVQTAKQELEKLHLETAVIGIAKRNEEVWFPFAKFPVIIPKVSPALHLIQRIRDEAHRFARKYHLLLRKKKITEK